MSKNFHFNPKTIESLVGGVSALDITKLNIQSLEEAEQFTLAYGFDVNQEGDSRQLWNYYRRAVTYIQTQLLEEGEEVPSTLSDPGQLKNLLYLLIYASTTNQRENSLQRWSCALLKVMHVLVHLDNDLFTLFYGDIQDQLIKPIQDSIYQDPAVGTTLGKPSRRGSIRLQKFELKSFKTSNSAITKLLAKKDQVAFTLLDKIGVRFVTKHLFDSFAVMRFLVKKNLVSFPHNIADQSNNTLYPLDLFMEVMEGFTNKSDMTSEQVDEILRAKLEKVGEKAKFKKKWNAFTSDEYRFIKFITRRLCQVELGDKKLKFFYPFEVQIMDYQTYLNNMAGESSHEEYKLRQKRKARVRVLGFDSTKPEADK